MAAFELNNEEARCENHDSKRIKEECLIALKIYDSCRKQDCLTDEQIGPARAAESICIGDDQYIHEGDIIVPPTNAASVTIDRLRIKKIIIVDKEPNPFRNGYWDIDLKYVFEYKLTFREADGCTIGSMKANSIFNKKVTLFGSVGSDLVIATDLFHDTTGGLIEAEPFVMADGKAVALCATLVYSRRSGLDEGAVPLEVHVTIGLFTIIRLFRVVDLSVESRGFCVPNECQDEVCPTNPCDFFNNLAFPMDIFAPPQKPEFFAGLAEIPKFEKAAEIVEKA